VISAGRTRAPTLSFVVSIARLAGTRDNPARGHWTTISSMDSDAAKQPGSRSGFHTAWFPYRQFHVPQHRQPVETVWRARHFEFHFPRPVVVLGIVNVTPDSFSDGGRFLDPEAAVAHGLELVAQGAEILDVGGESTRPNAEPVSETEELRRVLPVVEQLVGRVKVPISIDTQKPAVARAALGAGAAIVNDIAANRGDDAMWRVVAEAGAGYVCVHMQGTPQTMQVNPTYADVVGEVAEFFTDRLDRLNRLGVPAEQVALDVGIGFGKTAGHNLQLLAALERFTRLGRPLLLGVSRKSFIGRVVGAGLGQRLPASLACPAWAIASGTQMIRAHDVAETVQALRMLEAVLAHQR
jgi:dihydropteroate synthase